MTIEVHFVQGASPPVVFELPPLRQTVLIEPSARSEPNVVFTGRAVGPSGAPFTATSEDRLILFKLICIADHAVQAVSSIFVRSSSLVSIARERSGPELPVLWPEWGPKNTRWRNDLFPNPFVCNIHGLRYADVSNLTRSVTILDFNPYQIRRDQAEAGANEWEEKVGVYTRRLVLEPTVVSLPAIFAEQFTTYLPYKTTTLHAAQVDPRGAIMLDDERLMIFKVSVAADVVGYATDLR